jgi:chemotaxis protein methyltransferase CheR
MSAFGIDHLQQRDFQRLARFIQDYSGIKMPATKKTMVEGRLRRRVRALGLADLKEYCRYLFERNGLSAESVHLIDSVTTNKTDFFREPSHFEFLADVAIPTLFAERRATSRTPVKVWSAACSMGAEPYTLAMVFAELALRQSGVQTSILATDICTEVLEKAIRGIYPESMIDPVPTDMRRRYVMRGKNMASGKVRIVPELRRLVQFGRLNLMDEKYPVDRDMHAIFCRNILIYFDKETQRAVLERLCSHLCPGGYLFVGHSETLAGLGLPLTPAATSVYRRI